MARNSASANNHSTALWKNASTRNRTACTGLREKMTPSAAPMSTAEKK